MADDPFLTYDAAYVLGALTPDERRDYRQHLNKCDRCTVAVGELAGLPSLLARSRPDEITADTAATPPPSTLLPTLLASVRKQRHGTRRIATLTTMAAACLLAVVTLVVVRPQQATPAAGAPATAMAHLIAAPIDADASLTAVPSGTRIDMRCTYPDQPAYPAAPRSYLLVVIDQTGHVQQAASWRVVPGKVSSITASTHLTRDDIASLEVRTPDGQPVLRLVT